VERNFKDEKHYINQTICAIQRRFLTFSFISTNGNNDKRGKNQAKLCNFGDLFVLKVINTTYYKQGDNIQEFTLIDKMVSV
jgi:hypothetical protein